MNIIKTTKRGNPSNQDRGFKPIRECDGNSVECFMPFLVPASASVITWRRHYHRGGGFLRGA